MYVIAPLISLVSMAMGFVFITTKSLNHFFLDLGMATMAVRTLYYFGSEVYTNSAFKIINVYQLGSCAIAYLVANMRIKRSKAEGKSLSPAKYWAARAVQLGMTFSNLFALTYYYATPELCKSPVLKHRVP